MFPFSVESLNSLHVFLCEQRAVRAVGEVVVHTRGSGRSWRWSEPAPDCEPARVWLLHVQSWAGAGDRSGAGRPPLVVSEVDVAAVQREEAVGQSARHHRGPQSQTCPHRQGRCRTMECQSDTVV